jgi:lipopolysaccharide export system protein LptA
MFAATRRSGRGRRVAPILAALLMASAPGLPADTFSYSSDTSTMALARDAQHALLMGHARVETQDLRITANRIELFGKDLIYVQCSGNVHVVDAKRGLDLTSEEMFYDRDRKIAQIKGNAVMADLKNEIVARGGFIEDRDTEQVTIIQIGVRIFKNDISCRAEFARYYRDRKVLELSGMPVVMKGADVYVGTRITVNLDTEEISAEGGVSGTVQSSSTTQDQGAAQGQGTAQGQGAAQDQGATQSQGAAKDQGATQGGGNGGQ